MTDHTPPTESPITDRAHQELAEALGLSPHTGKTWDDLLKQVQDNKRTVAQALLDKVEHDKNIAWIRSLARTVNLQGSMNHLLWEAFCEDLAKRVTFITQEMRDRGDSIKSHHQQLADALGMENGSLWEALVDEAKNQTSRLRDRDSAAVRDLTIQLNKTLHVPPHEARNFQGLIELIQEYHHTLADAVNAGRSDHWKYVISKVEQQQRLLDLSERFRERLSELAKWEEQMPSLSWEGLLARVGDLAKNSWLDSYEKLKTYHHETETLKEELAKLHGMNPHLSWKEILTNLAIPQEELEKNRKTVASQLHRIKDLEQIFKDKATVLDKMTAKVDILEGEREQILDALDLITGSALEDILEKIGRVTVGFRSMAGGKAISSKVEDPDALTYPGEAIKQAHENGYKAGLEKAVDVARRVVQQTKEDLDARRKAIDEAQAQKEKAEAEERKAALEHIVAYDLLKMVEAAQVDKTAKATDFAIVYGPVMHVAQEKNP